MTLDALRVDSPGPLTTVQDLGRYGYQRFGVPVSGAMDKFALRAGNLMVGNRGNAAALEFTLAGPKLLVLRSCRVAVTGAEAPVELDGMSVPQWQAFNATAGSVLNVGTTVDGLRGYLCLSGGIKVPRVLGSRSTYLKSGFGGFKGEQFRKTTLSKWAGPNSVQLSCRANQIPALPLSMEMSMM